MELLNVKMQDELLKYALQAKTILNIMNDDINNFKDRFNPRVD